MESKPYRSKDLMTFGKPGPKEGHYLDEIALPLGGIGTGTISLTGRGQLIDWEIQNRPNKGSTNAFSFFTLWAREEGKDPITKVLAERPMRALSGFTFDAPGRAYGFAPKLSTDDFRTFWSTGTGWGTFAQRGTKKGAVVELSVFFGRLDVKRLSLSVGGAGDAKIFKAKEEISGHAEGVEGDRTAVVLKTLVTIGPGEALRVEFLG